MAEVMPPATEVAAETPDPSGVVPPAEESAGAQNASQETPSKSSAETASDPARSQPEEMSAIERIKAAQAARRSRRARAPPPAASATPGSTATSEQSSDDPVIASLRKEHAEEMATLRQEAATLRLEMGSQRRNHLQNLKKLSEERDMFAAQLVREQSASSKPTGDSRKLDDVAAQLRAARTRNTDLENENAVLRDDVKQLNFRVQASRTLDAASDGYEKIVDDLVAVKLKCAQLQEEKEDLLRMNKELMTTSAVLREANGDLEKSRSEWVVQCAELEKDKQTLEDKLREKDKKNSRESNDASDSGSLQDINLN